MYILTDEGKKYLREGLHEKKLLEVIKEYPIDFQEARKNVENFSIAVQWAKSRGWVEIRDNKICLKSMPKSFPEHDGLRAVADGKHVDVKTLSLLIKRRLVVEDREDMLKRARKFAGKEINNLTEEVIKTGIWRHVKFKPYNVEFAGKKIHPGKPHIISCYIDKIRKIFLDLGFAEAEGPLIESS